VVLENARKTLTAQQLLELKAENSDLVVRVGTRADTARNVGFALGRITNKLMKAARDAREDEQDLGGVGRGMWRCRR
jgi:hypothetical protein